MKEYGSEFSESISQTSYSYFSDLTQNVKDFAFFRSARECLFFLTKHLELKNSDSILLPAYCCDSMIDPFRKKGIDVIFYKLNKNLKPDKSYLAKQIILNKTKVVLLMNFFGIAPIQETAKFLKKKFPDLIIIEDITHSLFSIDISSSNLINFSVGSIRKWIGIPDGAILLSKLDILNKPKYTNNQFVEKRKVALQLKREYETTGDIRTKKNFRKLFGDAELFLNENYEYMPCSKESVRFIMSLDIHKIILKRYNNLRVLLNIIQFIKGIHIIKPIIKNHNVCPFTLPILVNNRDKVQKELAEKGLYAPILWPIDNEAKAICEVSKSFSEKMLAIPVDQRYNSFNMAEIGAILKGVLNS